MKRYIKFSPIIIIFCFSGCKKEMQQTENNSSQKPVYEKKENLKTEEEKSTKISTKEILKIPDSLQSFVGSCGTECAIVYNTRKIKILNQNKIAVHFDTEQIIQEEVENNSQDYIIFKYNEGGNLLFVTDETEKGDVIVGLPFSLAERMQDYGSRMYFVLFPEKRNKIFSKTLEYKGVAEVSAQFYSFVDENGNEINIVLNKNQHLTKVDIGKKFQCRYQYRKAISPADSETEYLQAFMMTMKP